MIGFKAKRALIDLLAAAAADPASGLYQVKVAYAYPYSNLSSDNNLPAECVYGGGGTGPTQPGVAEAVVSYDTAILSIVVRVAGAVGTERQTDTRAEALGEAVAGVVRANKTFAGPDTLATVSGKQWDNPSVDQVALTLLIVEVTVDGYV